MPSTDPAIAVLILTLNQRDQTLHCLRSLAAQTEIPFRIVVWDNGSEDGTAAAVRAAFPDVRVHHHPDNLGVAGGRNAAARLAIDAFNPSYFLFLDNDMELAPGFVAALLGPFLQDERVGQTQAKLRFFHDRERLNDGGGCRISFVLGRTRPVGYGEVDRGQYDRVRPCVACGGAMMVRTDVFQALGGFDLQFNPFGPEDLDFSLRLTDAGYRALFVPAALAYHAVSHTVGSDYDEHYARHKARHWFLFMKRHAPLWKRAVFLAVTAPILFAGILVREVARGNGVAVRGMLRGGLDALKG